jgi:hypothetical protein
LGEYAARLLARHEDHTPKFWRDKDKQCNEYQEHGPRCLGRQSSRGGLGRRGDPEAGCFWIAPGFALAMTKNGQDFRRLGLLGGNS